MTNPKTRSFDNAVDSIKCGNLYTHYAIKIDGWMLEEVGISLQKIVPTLIGIAKKQGFKSKHYYADPELIIVFYKTGVSNEAIQQMAACMVDMDASKEIQIGVPYEEEMCLA